MLNDNEFIAQIKKIKNPQEMLRCLIDNMDRGIFGNDSDFADIKHVIIQQARSVSTFQSKNYPEPWVSVNIYMNTKTGEIHCDGDEGSIKFIQEKMHDNGKVHNTLHSVDALDNLSLVIEKGTEHDLLEYVRSLVAKWATKRPGLVSTLCPVCGGVGDLDCKLVHKHCLEHISKSSNSILLPGCIVKLKKNLLGNDVGAFGTCYESYQLGHSQGASFIFENGEYDGFSPDEQKEFLELVGQSEEAKHYKFTNVMQLSADFRSVDSLFKRTFDYANHMLKGD